MRVAFIIISSGYLFPKYPKVKIFFLLGCHSTLHLLRLVALRLVIKLSQNVHMDCVLEILFDFVIQEWFCRRLSCSRFRNVFRTNPAPSKSQNLNPRPRLDHSSNFNLDFSISKIGTGRAAVHIFIFSRAFSSKMLDCTKEDIQLS